MSAQRMSGQSDWERDNPFDRDQATEPLCPVERLDACAFSNPIVLPPRSRIDPMMGLVVIGGAVGIGLLGLTLTVVRALVEAVLRFS